MIIKIIKKWKVLLQILLQFSRLFYRTTSGRTRPAAAAIRRPREQSPRSPQARPALCSSSGSAPAHRRKAADRRPASAPYPESGMREPPRARAAEPFPGLLPGRTGSGPGGAAAPRAAALRGSATARHGTGRAALPCAALPCPPCRGAHLPEHRAAPPPVPEAPEAAAGCGQPSGNASQPAALTQETIPAAGRHRPSSPSAPAAAQSRGPPGAGRAGRGGARGDVCGAGASASPAPPGTAGQQLTSEHMYLCEGVEVVCEAGLPPQKKKFFFFSLGKKKGLFGAWQV